MLRVEYLQILGIGGIDNLEINFNDKFNLICGPNGVGKTTILESIVISLSRYYSDEVRRKANYELGNWRTHFKFRNEEFKVKSETKYFHPFQRSSTETSKSTNSYEYQKGAENYLIVYKTNRSFSHVKLSAISSDSKDQNDQDILTKGVVYGNTKNWFVNRFMWSKHENTLEEVQIQNFELAKTLFGALDSTVKFKTVKADTFDIILTDKINNEIYFEYLSSGFKSSLYILFSLFKEIEFRFKNPSILITDFDGILIIDELDLHLHPQWQAKIVKVLRDLLPKAQIIVTSHSPHMLQVVNANEVIPLGFDDSGKVVLRNVKSNEYGFQGWTVEEILTNVMGLEAVHSELYLNTLKDFENALDEDNKEKAEKAFEILDKMLHRSNHLRKILKIQMASLGE